jgi:hypothetical protein
MVYAATALAVVRGEPTAKRRRRRHASNSIIDRDRCKRVSVRASYRATYRDNNNRDNNRRRNNEEQ